MDLHQYQHCSKTIFKVFSTDSSFVLVPLFNRINCEHNDRLMNDHNNTSFTSSPFSTTDTTVTSTLDANALSYFPKHELVQNCNILNNRHQTTLVHTTLNPDNVITKKGFSKILKKIQTMNATLSTIKNEYNRLNSNCQYHDQKLHLIDDNIA